MRVMFVCSGNSKAFSMAPFIRSQGESLKESGISVSYYPLKGKGLWGYLKNVPLLFMAYRRERFDLVHAHYGCSALVALLALPFRPVVVSFMGSDAYGECDRSGLKRKNFVARLAFRIVERWADYVIVKSPNIRACLSTEENTALLPNGVNLDAFSPMDKASARRLLGLSEEGNKVMFLGNVACERKNFDLCREAVEESEMEIEIVAPYPVKHDLVRAYLSAADVLVLTSHEEGSPNVVKEAMACGCPVVTTDVGDVRWLLDGVSGCRVVGFDVPEVARAIEDCLSFSGRTNGRERLIELGLDSRSVASRLKAIYAGLLPERQEQPEAYECRKAANPTEAES